MSIGFLASFAFPVRCKAPGRSLPETRDATPGMPPKGTKLRPRVCESSYKRKLSLLERGGRGGNVDHATGL